MNANAHFHLTRREFLSRTGILAGAAAGAAAVGGATFLGGTGLPGGGPSPGAASAAEATAATTAATSRAAASIDISPTEDLMREHGLLRRVMFMWDDMAARLTADKDVPASVLADSAGLVKRFINDYHEKLEEDYIFPRCRKAGLMADMVQVLQRQHEAGRGLVAELLDQGPGQLADPAGRRGLWRRLTAFNRMYRPHAAREDTELYQAFLTIVSAEELDKLADTFEGIEQGRFGKGGYEKLVRQASGMEKALGLADLAEFTPKA